MYPTLSSTNAVTPDQLVTTTGRPIDMASVIGMPQPSPRVGITYASADCAAGDEQQWGSKRSVCQKV